MKEARRDAGFFLLYLQKIVAMAKISTYIIDQYPTLDDILIGSDRVEKDKTKNYRIQDVLNLAPAYTLQGVTDLGNTTTNPIITPATVVQYIDFVQSGTSIQPMRMMWNSADGTLDVGMGYDGVVGQMFLEQFYHIRATGSISDGQVVMFDGAIGASGKMKGKVSTSAVNSFPRSLMGIATMDMTNGSDGFVTQFGVVRGINTSQWESGDVLWWNPSVPGGMTNIMPDAPNAKVVLAAVINKHAQQGSIFVRPSYGLKLSEVHDVKYYNPNDVVDKSILTFVKANERWEPVSSSDLFVHNSLGGLNDGDYIHMTQSQAIYLSSLTSLTNGYIPMKSADSYVNSPMFHNEGILSVGNSVTGSGMRIYGSVEVGGDLKDRGGSSGEVGQIVKSLGEGNGFEWANPSDSNSYKVDNLIPGINILAIIPVTRGYGAYVDYAILSTDNIPYRIGTLYCVWTQYDAEYMDYGSKNIGISSDVVVLRAVNNGANVSVIADISAGSYNVKLQIRYI